MFKIIRLRPVLMALVVFLVSVVLSVGIVSVVNTETIPKSVYKIVLDAGHGGLDVK